MHILLVDDEKCILDILGDFLNDCGYTVSCANDGATALKLLETTPTINLVISDIRMPKINGMECLRAIQVRYPGLPTILITGHGDEKSAINAFYDGAYDYLKKPIGLETLLNTIKRLEKQKKLENQFSTPQLSPANHITNTCHTISNTIQELRDICAKSKPLDNQIEPLINKIDLGLSHIKNHLHTV